MLRRLFIVLSGLSLVLALLYQLRFRSVQVPQRHRPAPNALPGPQRPVQLGHVPEIERDAGDGLSACRPGVEAPVAALTSAFGEEVRVAGELRLIAVKGAAGD